MAADNRPVPPIAPGRMDDVSGRQPDNEGNGERDWRRMFVRLLGLIITLLALSTFATGVLLIIMHKRVSGDQDTQNVIAEIGVTLASFGGTTLLITLFASQQLEEKLLGRFGDRMNEHVRAVRSTMDGAVGTFRQTIDAFVPLFDDCRKLGLENVYLTRADALCKFGEYIKEELKSASSAAPIAGPESTDPALTDDDAAGAKEKVRLWVVGSSMKGILETAVAGFDGAGLLSWAAFLAANDMLDLRILLTDPGWADYRAEQEHRHKGAIPEEITEAQKFLDDRNVPRKCVRLAKATPTVFAIATRDRMLLNPYPYGAEAYRSFTLTVRRVNAAPNDHPALHRDIFEQYEHRHFRVPWDSADPLPDLRPPAGPPPDHPAGPAPDHPAGTAPDQGSGHPAGQAADQAAGRSNGVGTSTG